MKKTLIVVSFVFIALIIISGAQFTYAAANQASSNPFFKSILTITAKNYDSRIKNIVTQKSTFSIFNSAYQKYFKTTGTTSEPQAYCPNTSTEETVERNGCGPYRTGGGTGGPTPSPSGGVDGPCQNGYKITVYPGGRVTTSPCSTGGLQNPLDGLPGGVTVNVGDVPGGSAENPNGTVPGVTVVIPIGGSKPPDEPPITTAPENAAQAAKRRAKERAEACLADPSACGSGTTNMNTHGTTKVVVPEGPTLYINTTKN